MYICVCIYTGLRVYRYIGRYVYRYMCIRVYMHIYIYTRVGICIALVSDPKTNVSGKR